MRGSFLRCARRWSAGCALSVLAAGAAWAQQPVQVFQVQEGTPPGVQVLVVDGGETGLAAAPKLWVGLVFEPAGDVLRSQLNLPPEQGLVVREVIPESPAAAAGVQQFDILLTVNETPVNDVWALIRFVEEAGPAELTLQIVRQGERQELKLTPTERPAAAAIPAGAGAAGGGLVVPGGVEWQQLGQPPFRVFMTQPAQIVAHMAEQGELALPEGLHVILRKQGPEPTVVVVERGEERWEVEIGKLDELPDDVQAQVTAYLHSLGFTAMAGSFGFTPATPVPAVPGIPVPHVVPFPGRAFEVPVPPGVPAGPDVQQRLDELQRQLEELRERIESQEREAADRPDDSGVRSSFINFRCA